MQAEFIKKGLGVGDTAVAVLNVRINQNYTST
jgi:hypothetical protein